MNPENLRTGTAAESDLDEIAALERESFKHPWDRLAFAGELSCGHSRNCIVRHDTGCGTSPLVAYLFYHLVVDEIHILRIAVGLKWRGCGIAARMLGEILDKARISGMAASFLEVRPSNTAAIALYRKLGFHVIGKRSGYYPETGEDALVLMKNMKEAL